MNKFEKTLAENPAMKKIVLDILQSLNGESYSDAKTVLDLATHFLKENAYVDFELARDRIDNVKFVEGD